MWMLTAVPISNEHRLAVCGWGKMCPSDSAPDVKDKTKIRSSSKKNHTLAFSETSGPAVPQCGVLQPRGSAGCGVRGTAQADPGVAGPENSQEGKNSGEQISSVPFLLKPANSPMSSNKVSHLCSMVLGQLRDIKISVFSDRLPIQESTE